MEEEGELHINITKKNSRTDHGVKEQGRRREKKLRRRRDGMQGGSSFLWIPLLNLRLILKGVIIKLPKHGNPRVNLKNRKHFRELLCVHHRTIAKE